MRKTCCLQFAVLLLLLNTSFAQDANGRIGLEIREVNGKIIVGVVERWGPAKKAGLQSGDILVRINDTPVQGLAVPDVAALSRGPVGSTVMITVLRDNVPQTFNVIRQDLSPGKLGFRWQGGQDLPRIIYVQKNGPADRSGIRAGDYIVQVDDVDMKRTGIPREPDPPPGAEVTLVLLRQGKGAPVSFKLVSDPLDEIDTLKRKAIDLANGGKFDEAAANNRMAAEKGDPQAQHILGTLYLDGKGVPRDAQEALKWLKKAADQGYEPALESIALMYGQGQGVKQDLEQALEWRKKAADRGNPNDQYIVGWDYKMGVGTKQDHKKSFEYHQMAAQMGEVHSLNDLAVFYMDGDTVARDIQKALSLFQQSWERGEPVAALNIGLIYKRGLDVPVDYSQAAKWFRLAADQGNTQAKDELNQLPQVTFVSNEVEPAELHPGQTLKISSILDVGDIPEDGTVPVVMERQILLKDQPLFRSPKTETQDLTKGRHTTFFEFATPPDATPGTYKVVITLRALGTETTKETFFVIR